jgi:hypothetical protein
VRNHLLTFAALTILLVAGCSGSNPFTTPFSPSVSPGPSVGVGPGGGSGDGGSPGGGTIGGGGAGGGPIVPGKPGLVVPKPGQVNLLPVSITELVPISLANPVVVEARWWSGIEPCSVLDSVVVERDGNTITISAREGSQPGQPVACIDIAMYKGTRIDLGRLAAGTYTIRAGRGDAKALTITIPG